MNKTMTIAGGFLVWVLCLVLGGVRLGKQRSSPSREGPWTSTTRWPLQS